MPEPHRHTNTHTHTLTDDTHSPVIHLKRTSHHLPTAPTQSWPPPSFPPFPSSSASALCPQTCVARAWDFSKPMLLAPAMNSAMWVHPLTSSHLRAIQSFPPPSSPSSVVVVSPIVKLLACGDVGEGAMAEVGDIDRRMREVADSVKGEG